MTGYMNCLVKDAIDIWQHLRAYWYSFSHLWYPATSMLQRGRTVKKTLLQMTWQLACHSVQDKLHGLQWLTTWLCPHQWLPDSTHCSSQQSIMGQSRPNSVGINTCSHVSMRSTSDGDSKMLDTNSIFIQSPEKT